MKTPKDGFTLVELLVVITIIAILIMLLLPAVQAAREAARQSQCRNNMKQLGLACLDYESLHGCFPPSSYYDESAENPATSRVVWRNWVISIMPFLEQQPLYDSFTLGDSAGKVSINDARNEKSRSTELPVMKCPADPNAKVKFSSVSTTEGGNWARGNYAANASMGFYNPHKGISWGEPYSAVGANSVLSRSRYHRGIMGANLSMGISECYDGTSNTFLLGEIRAGLSQHDRRGTWALSGPGASSLWEHGANDANGPNSCVPGGDDILDSDAFISDVGSANLKSQCMLPGGGANNQAGMRSCHEDGVNVVMADGGVRFVSNYIEKGASWIWDANLTYGGVKVSFLCWERLCASQDGLTVDGAKF